MTTADIVIHNARVLTMDGAKPRAEAVAIAGGQLMAVGGNSDVLALKGNHTRMIDAQMMTVMPGIVESHMHLFPGSVELDSLMLTGVTGMEALTAAVRGYAAQRPDDSIIVANGAHYLIIREDATITRQDLDQVLPDRPFMMASFDHHTVWANTKALEAAGLLRGKALPAGNEIVMGSDGLATGELREIAAFGPLFHMTPTQGREGLGMATGEGPSPVATARQRRTDMAALKRGLAYCASLGITSIHNMDGNWYQLKLLENLLDAGDLTCRVQIPWHQKNFFPVARIREAAEMREQYSGPMLKSGMVKVFVDGVLESMTALMLDDYPGHPGKRGDPLFSAEELNAVCIEADRRNLQIAIHSIGDGGVRRTLDAFEAARRANGRRDSRHRVEHIEVIDPADIPRFKELGVIASMQPIVGLGVPGSILEPCLSRIGAKMPYAYAWQTIREAGANMAFSSDWPVSSLNPFLGMQSAMTHTPVTPDLPKQRQGLMDTLAAFTSGGAYAEFAEHSKGKLKPGFMADVIVLDADIEKTAPEEIAQIKPVVTICGGKVTHEA